MLHYSIGPRPLKLNSLLFKTTLTARYPLWRPGLRWRWHGICIGSRIGGIYMSSLDLVRNDGSVRWGLFFVGATLGLGSLVLMCVVLSWLGLPAWAIAVYFLFF